MLLLSPNIGSKYLTLAKAGQQFRVQGMLMPHLLHSSKARRNNSVPH